MSGAISFFMGGAGLTVSVSPPIASGSGTTSTGVVGSVTATPAGGSGGYTYAWTVIESDFSMSVNSPSAATTGFTFTGVPAGEVATGVARVTVTSGAQTATADVDVSYLRHVS